MPRTNHGLPGIYNATPVTVPDGKGSALAVDANGRLIAVLAGEAAQTNIVSSSGLVSNTDGASTALIAAQGAGVLTYITDITITNTSASMIYVEIKDGTTTKWVFPVPATGGVTHSFETPLKGTANTAWNFDPSAATTTVYIAANGYTATA